MKRVFLYMQNPLYSECIEQVLKAEPGAEIVGRERSLDTAVARIRELQPDVVMIEAAECEGADSVAVAIRILRDCVGARVVAIDLVENRLNIYHGVRKIVQHADDLAHAVLGTALEDDP